MISSLDFRSWWDQDCGSKLRFPPDYFAMVGYWYWTFWHLLTRNHRLQGAEGAISGQMPAALGEMVAHSQE